MAHESNVTARVHKLLPKADMIADKLQVNNIGGIPDAYYSGPMREHWIEYKRIPEPPIRDTTLIKPDLSPSQKVRLRRQEEFTRSQWVVVYIDSTTTFVLYRTSEQWENGILLSNAETYLGYKAFAAVLYRHVVGRNFPEEEKPVLLKPPRIHRGSDESH